MHAYTYARTYAQNDTHTHTALMLVLLASHDDYTAADAIDKKKQVPVCVSGTRGMMKE